MSFHDFRGPTTFAPPQLSPQPLIRQPDLPCYLVEFLSGWFYGPIRHDPEGIAGVAREDVQVNVRDLLKSRFSIGQKEIDPFTPHAALADCSREALGNGPQAPPGLLIQLSQAGRVSFGDDHHVPRGDRPNRHDSQQGLILIEYAGGAFSRHDPAENAFVHGVPPTLPGELYTLDRPGQLRYFISIHAHLINLRKLTRWDFNQE